MLAKKLGVFTIVLCGIVGLAGIPASADSVPVSLYITGNADGNVTNGSVENPEGLVNQSSFLTQGNISNDSWVLDYTLSGDLDPVVSNVFSITNFLGVSVTYDIFNTIPAVVLPASITGGSVSGSVTDLNGDGATASVTPGASLYYALIDSGVYDTLYDGPQAFTTAIPFGSLGIPAVAFGVPIPSQPGPAVLSDIGVHLHFTLTPYDSVSFTSVFVVEPYERQIVPEPSSLALLGMGVVGLMRKFVVTRA